MEYLRTKVLYIETWVLSEDYAADIQVNGIERVHGNGKGEVG